MAKKQKDEQAAAEEGGEAAAPKPKSGRLRLIVVAAAALLLCAGAGGGAYYVFFAHADAKVAEPPPKPPTFFDLPEILVNLSGTGSERPQYLKVKVVLEVPDAAVIDQIKPVLPRVMDTFQVFLRELRPTDLEGSAGVFRLREELTRRVNTAIAPSKITAVLFKEMVIQ
ncbi:MAG TPA: flagellar basal body-associated protein FliL [Xanthobacteraceae bacterium]|nr:flagellar basal body-associated protein FliL [Xanthobacteraceae bacterium]